MELLTKLFLILNSKFLIAFWLSLIFFEVILLAETNFIDTNWEEHYIKRGDPSKPTYYIIRRPGEAVGLFARYNSIAGRIRHALVNGWLPVVDMQNYPNPYLSPEKLGKENSWEYYFEQPLRIGLEQAYSGENIILSDNDFKIFSPWWHMDFFENRNNVLTEWRMLRKFGLLKIKPALHEEILSVRDKMFSTEDRVLGVLLRGTDYLDMKPHSHPIAPPLEFAVSVVVEKLQEWKCNKIYLATEDKKIVQTFKNVFGDLCVALDREYVDYQPGQAIGTIRIDRENDHYLQGKEYLLQIAIAATCNSFIAARCSGSVSVMMLADNFEHTYFFNLGKYGLISLD